MNSQNNMPEKNSNKNPIKKIVVCGCSFSLPGQSGIETVWSQHLQNLLTIPVVNITKDAGAGNSEILRRITEYCWSNDISQTGFIIQWSSIDRLEFCDEHDWYSTKRSYEDKPVQLKLDKIKEAQAYTYCESTYLWQFIQQILALKAFMDEKSCRYFQVYCVGSVLNDFLHQVKDSYFSKHGKQIFKSLSSTKWLMNNILNADLSNKGYPVVSKQDLHFNQQGHSMIADTMSRHIKKEKWL